MEILAADGREGAIVVRSCGHCPHQQVAVSTVDAPTLGEDTHLCTRPGYGQALVQWKRVPL